jgi:hypothetical protein
MDAVVHVCKGIPADDTTAVSDALSSLWPLKLCECFDLRSYATDWELMGCTAADDGVGFTGESSHCGGRFQTPSACSDADAATT